MCGFGFEHEVDGHQSLLVFSEIRGFNILYLLWLYSCLQMMYSHQCKHCRKMVTDRLMVSVLLVIAMYVALLSITGFVHIRGMIRTNGFLSAWSDEC